MPPDGPRWARCRSASRRPRMSAAGLGPSTSPRRDSADPRISDGDVPVERRDLIVPAAELGVPPEVVEPSLGVELSTVARVGRRRGDVASPATRVRRSRYRASSGSLIKRPTPKRLPRADNPVRVRTTCWFHSCVRKPSVPSSTQYDGSSSRKPFSHSGVTQSPRRSAATTCRWQSGTAPAPCTTGSLNANSSAKSISKTATRRCHPIRNARVSNPAPNSTI